MNGKKLFVVAAALCFAVASFAQEEDEAEQTGKFGETPEDSIKCVRSLSLYYEFYKNEDFKSAKVPWKNAVTICPASRKSLYIRGEKMYKKFIDEAEDKAKKNAFIDTLMWIYDLRIEHFNEKGFVLGKKGSDLMKYRSSEAETANKILSEALELQGKKMGPVPIIYLFNSAYVLHRKEKKTKAELAELYSRLIEIAEYNIKNPSNEQYVKYYEQAKDNLDKIFSKVASCEDLVEIFQPRLEAAPEDTALIKTIIQLLNKNKCTDSELFITAAKKMFEINPSAEAAYNIAIWYASKDKCAEAIDFYKKAGETAEDDERKIKSYLDAAKCYIKLGNNSAARTYAQKVIAVNPNNGEAYITIGDAYAASKNECGGNECTAKAVYWIAVDKYQQAKSVDPSVAEVANKRIATYSKHFPKKEDCFFHGLNDGDSYKVECWINETTTVRVIE